MPLLELRHLNSHTFIGIWHITESVTELQQVIPAHLFVEEFAVLKTEKRQKEWLASRLLIHRLQQQFSQKTLPVSKNKYGKPIIPGSDLKLSLTHSGPYAAAILSDKQEVGIDIEFISQKVTMLAPKFLSETEKTDANGDHEKICLYWSAKETLYKLYGRKKLLFIENLPVNPFIFKETGTLSGSIITPDNQHTYQVFYEKLNEYILTFCTGDYA